MASTTQSSHSDDRSTSSGWVTRLSLLVAAASVFALATTALVGWHAHVVRLVQIGEGCVPIQYNTAVGLLLCSLGTLLAAGERYHAAMVATSVACLLAFLTLLEYATGASLAIDQLFATGLATAEMPFPRRMTIHSAVSLIITSASVFAAARGARAGQPSMVSAILSPIVLAIGAAAALGFALGLEHIHGWLGWWRFSQMAPQTAFGLIVLGAGLTAASVSAVISRPSLPQWLPASPGIAILAFSCLLTNAVRQTEHQQVVREATILAERLARDVEHSVTARGLALHGMASSRESRGEAPSENRTDLQAAAASLQIDALGRIDSSMQLRLLSDSDKYERHVRIDDATRQALESSRDSGMPLILQPNVRGQAEALQIFEPLYDEQGFDGFLLGIVLIDRLLDPLVERTTPQLAVSVSGEERVLYRDPGMLTPSAGYAPVTASAHFLSMDWLVTAHVTRRFLLPSRFALSRFCLLAGAIVSILATLAIRGFLAAHRSSIRLQAANEDLEEELIQRREAESVASQHVAKFAEANRVLHERSAELEGVLASTVDPLLTIDENGSIQMVSDSVETVFGWSREELVGRNVSILMPEPDRTRHDSYLAAYHETGVKRVIGRGREVLAKRKDESVFPAELRVADVAHGFSDTRLYAGVIRDISNQKAVEADLKSLASTLEERNAALLASNEELERFAYVASHDLRAPLRAIHNLSTWIEEDSGEAISPESQEHLATLRGRVGRMERLLDALLQYSRAGRVRKSAPKEVNTERLIHDVVELIGPPEGFHVLVGGSLPNVRSERVPLEQVFLNLISNAIKHHDQDEGLIEVTGAIRGNVAEFTVADDGPGIADEFHERIFEMFQTLKPRDEVEANGMGLALVRKIVRSHGGEITVDSVVGTGTRFRFSWPLSEPVPGGPEERREPDVAGAASVLAEVEDLGASTQ